LKQLVENSSHGIKTAKTGDFGRFSAAFADPECRAGAIDPGFRVYAPLSGQLPQLPRQSGAGDFSSVTDFQIREVPTNRSFEEGAEKGPRRGGGRTGAGEGAKLAVGSQKFSA
jgi:hypothetical protein